MIAGNSGTCKTIQDPGFFVDGNKHLIMEKSPAEKAFKSKRISLTYRKIGTFLTDGANVVRVKRSNLDCICLVVSSASVSSLMTLQRVLPQYRHELTNTDGLGSHVR